MRLILILTLLCILALPMFAQLPDRQAQADQVKTAIQKIAGNKKKKLEIHTRGLVKLAGKIDAVDDQSFRMKIDLKSAEKPIIRVGWKRPSKFVTVRYGDVLQLKAKDVLLSFIPDPNQTPYGNWHELRYVEVGEVLQVHLKDGAKMHGVFMRWTEDQLRLMKGNTESNFQRDDITRVYRVTGDVRDLHSRIMGGAAGGAKITDDLFPINDPQATAHPAAIGIGVVAGVLFRLIPDRGATRVLAYAK